MYDIPELEKKWHKYKRNKIKKPIIIGAVATIILVGSGALISTYLLNKNSSKKVVVTTPQQVSKVEKTDSAIVIKRVSDNRPSTNTVKNNNAANSQNESDGIDLSKAEIVKTNVPDDEIRMIGFNKKEKESVKKKYEDVLVPKQTEADIQEREKAAELEDKFKNSQDPQDSLAVARYYYSKGDYKKAENWAVNTNNLDGDIEESWLIFAKSRAKQGFRTEAIKVLQSYYDETNSKNAKKLLDKLRFGKDFK